MKNWQIATIKASIAGNRVIAGVEFEDAKGRTRRAPRITIEYAEGVLLESVVEDAVRSAMRVAGLE